MSNISDIEVVKTTKEIIKVVMIANLLEKLVKTAAFSDNADA
jgi:hypothetical protein